MARSGRPFGGDPRSLRGGGPRGRRHPTGTSDPAPGGASRAFRRRRRGRSPAADRRAAGAPARLRGGRRLQRASSAPPAWSPWSRIALVAAIGGVWYLFLKDGDSASASSDTTAQPAGASNGTPTTTVPKPVDSTLVPAESRRSWRTRAPTPSPSSTRAACRARRRRDRPGAHQRGLDRQQGRQPARRRDRPHPVGRDVRQGQAGRGPERGQGRSASSAPRPSTATPAPRPATPTSSCWWGRTSPTRRLRRRRGFPSSERFRALNDSSEGLVVCDSAAPHAWGPARKGPAQRVGRAPRRPGSRCRGRLRPRSVPRHLAGSSSPLRVVRPRAPSAPPARPLGPRRRRSAMTEASASTSTRTRRSTPSPPRWSARAARCRGAAGRPRPAGGRPSRAPPPGC